MWPSGALFHFGGTCMSSGRLPMGQRGWWTEWSFSLQGGLVGVLLLPFIRKVFTEMFRARHEATRKIFES